MLTTKHDLLAPICLDLLLLNLTGDNKMYLLIIYRNSFVVMENDTSIMLGKKADHDVAIN